MRNLVVLILLFVFAGQSFAGAFDDRYPSARATGMSNAFVAVANDAWAAYYNPAGLAAVNNNQVAISYHRPFGYRFFNAFFGTAVLPISETWGSVGVSVESFAVKYNGNTLNEETVTTFSHGFYLLNDIHTTLSVGYNLKYYHMNLGESVGGLDLGNAGTFGLDIGAQASIYKRTYLGIYVYNFNSPSLGEVSAQDLPRRMVLGMAYKPSSGLTTSVSMSKTLGEELIFEGGFEFELVEYLTLRLGTSTNPSRFSAGIGVNYEGFVLDYGFRSHPVLAETHNFGLSYGW